MEMTKSQIIAEIEQCKKRIEELDKIAQGMKDDELKVWQPRNQESYIYINTSGFPDIDTNDLYCEDKNRIVFHNVFPESSTDSCRYYAKNVLTVQNMLWQLHELLCPDYFPNWDDNSVKFTCSYLRDHQRWDCARTVGWDNNVVYFTHEAAIKACEILNRDEVTK